MKSHATLMVLMLLGAATCCIGQSTVDVAVSIDSDNLLVKTLVNPALNAVVTLLNNTINNLQSVQSEIANRLKSILQSITDAVQDTTGKLKDRLNRIRTAVQTAIEEIKQLSQSNSTDVALKSLLAALQALLSSLNFAISVSF